MAGTVSGGQAAAHTNKQRYGTDYYGRIGGIGGRTPKTKPSGFRAMDKERVRLAGSLGGKISRRGSKLTPEQRQDIRRKFRISTERTYAQLLKIQRDARTSPVTGDIMENDK